jgi:short-subunit dehydrogenase
VIETTSKTAFITGASSGLGAEYAYQLARLGYNLILTARRSNRLEQVAATIQSKYPVNITVLLADLSKLTDIQQLAATIGGLADLDLLINNAGFGTVGRFYRVETTKELDMLHVHVLAPVMLCRAAVPGMLARNHGSIINVSSLAGLIPIRNVVYQSTKSFLVSFSYALRNELIDSQVHVQVLCPGFVCTEFHDTPEYTHFSRHGVPEFLWMTPEQVVTDSLKSLPSQRWICIPGHLYGIAGALARNSFSAGLIRLAAQLVLRRRRTFINT